MGFFGVLVFNFGAFCAIAAAECIPETARCSEYWEKILPHKDLISSEAELNSWCSKQARFYQCLEDVLLEGKNGNLSHLPTNLLISKLISQDLCSEGSKSRTRLLNSADCINQLNTDFCILPEYLDIVTPDDDIPSTRCSQAEKTFSCIAATIVLNCGFDAGRVYRTMLKITRYSDEVCGIETSEGVPPCEGSRSKSAGRDKKLSEIYYGLFHRIGDMLDPDEQSETKDSTSDVSEESEHVDEVVTAAIKRAITNLEESVTPKEFNIAGHLYSKPYSRSVSCSKDIKEHKPHMKNPAITEVFKDMLFFNYSGMEYALYWRQPEFSKFDRMFCNQRTPSFMELQLFVCVFDIRKNDPDCISNATDFNKLTPEFIRSFDPEVPCDSVVEFGPRPEFMSELDEKIGEHTESSTVEARAACSDQLDFAATMCRKKDLISRWFKNFDAMNLNTPISNELYYTITDLFWSDLENWNSLRVKTRDSTHYVMYDAEFTKPVENITCSRIDECHPRGRDLWKCKIWPRQIENKPAPIYARPYPKPSFTVLDTTEPTVRVESGVLHSSIPFIEQTSFSDYAESEKEVAIDHPQNEFNKRSSFTNDEASFEDRLKEDESDKLEYKLVSDSDIDAQLQILNSILNSDKDSEVYAMEGADAEDGDSEVIIATEDGNLAGNILVIKDLSDLGEAQYKVVNIARAI